MQEVNAGNTMRSWVSGQIVYKKELCWRRETLLQHFFQSFVLFLGADQHQHVVFVDL
jgi:hypothetical protein